MLLETIKRIVELGWTGVKGKKFFYSSKTKRNFLEAAISFPFVSQLYSLSKILLRDIEFRPVQTVDELKSAAKLVYQTYLKNGLIRPNTQKLRLSLFHALPTTTTFIAIYKKKHIFGTATVIEDTPLGLPMDQVYHHELNILRSEHHHLAEVSMLAFDLAFCHQVFSSSKTKELVQLIYFFKTLFDYIQSVAKSDEIVVCYHPSHDVMYNFLQFKPLGELKSHPGVQGSPAVARHLNIPEIRNTAKAHVAYKLFFHSVPSAEPFVSRLRYAVDDFRHVFFKWSDVLRKARPEERKYIQSQYPRGYFQETVDPFLSNNKRVA